MHAAMIVLKPTPNGFKLLPVSEVTGGRGLRLQADHAAAWKVREVMGELMRMAKYYNSPRGVTLKALYDDAVRKGGTGSFAVMNADSVKFLSASGETPARILITVK